MQPSPLSPNDSSALAPIPRHQSLPTCHKSSFNKLLLSTASNNPQRSLNNHSATTRQKSGMGFSLIFKYFQRMYRVKIRPDIIITNQSLYEQFQNGLINFIQAAMKVTFITSPMFLTIFNQNHDARLIHHHVQNLLYLQNNDQCFLVVLKSSTQPFNLQRVNQFIKKKKNNQQTQTKFFNLS